MKKIFLILLSVGSMNAFSQDWPVKKMVMATKARQVPFPKMPAFSFIADKNIFRQGTYQLLRLDKSFSQQLLQQRPDAMQITIPLSNNQTITCELIKFSLGNIKFTENRDGIINNPTIPITYRGIVSGEQNKNTVTLTVNEDYLALVVSMTDKVIQVTKADETGTTDYRLYNSAKIQFPASPLNCGTDETPAAKTSSGIDLTGGQTPLAVQDKCVNVMVDCSDSMFQWQNSNRQKVINYVYELFNEVATGYFNDSVNVQITTINVWTTASPFRAPTRAAALSQVAAYWQDNFFGNICVGLDYSLNSTSGRSGLAGDIGRVKAVTTNTCPAYTATKSACCYCDMNYSVVVSNFPTGPNTTQQQVYLTMHEMGHLLGAHHTKWCGWKLTSNPDTFGTLDSCGVIEGSCVQGPPPPGNGATIMSYCVTSTLNGNFVGYYNGFGLLPGNAIRNFIDQSPCIMLCVDCFGFTSQPSNNNDYAFYNKGPVIIPGNKSREAPYNISIPLQPSANSPLLPTFQKTKQ